MYESRGCFENTFLGFGDQELTSVQVSPLLHFKESEKLKHNLEVFANRLRMIFFSLLGATLWGILIPTASTAPDKFQFLTKNMVANLQKLHFIANASSNFHISAWDHLQGATAESNR